VAGERILVVDDGADMREFVIKYVLQPNGFDYREAEDGVAAFEVITTDPPDLILLDLQMPRLDGVGLLKKMSEHEISIPVVLMTFYGSEEIAIEVFRLGVRDYVIKPFTEEELLEAVERSLTTTRLRKERDTLTDRLLYANRELERRISELEALHRVGRVIAGLPDQDTLLVRILEAAAYLANAEEAALLLLGENRRSLVRRAFKAGGDVQLTNQPADSALARRAVRSGQLVTGQPYPDEISQQMHVQICAPLIVGDTPIGALSITTLADLASQHYLNLLTTLADYAAIGLERAGPVDG
jgi:DNA-binding response OmpR family regulator